ncbi:RNA methyltransferase [Bifidobacterium sp. ESL0790]|uniref:TrmH family RNA methyltransferase n=1 Tax=Bifidobacterium sp. ESL0790 TaxID=2983233 RepID=UPI0023F7E890|nr:RNA methyltransferase [Bifidobacterium sp. ESL0790]WEV71816.1 RNA methyltransferase [Bifidobacterium sp. ESL0790]
MPFNQHIIDNPKSERVRRVAELEKTKARKKSGRFIVEGPQSVRELVRWMPNVVEDCYVQLGERQGGLISEVVDAIAREADDQGLYIHQVTEPVMHHMSTDSQGIVAVADLDAMRGRMANAFNNGNGNGNGDGDNDQGSTNGTIAAFWQIRDPGNAGTVIRSADAAGCKAVIFVDECVDRFNPKVIRSTAGSLFHLPVVTMGTDEFFAWAQVQSLGVMAADVYGTPEVRPESLIDVIARSSGSQENDTSMAGGRKNDVSDAGPKDSSRVIIFGNEARGLPEDVLRRVQCIVSIPLYGKAESLNLATSTSVMLFSLAMADHARANGR